MGIPKNIIIDGSVFKIPGLDFNTFIGTGKVISWQKTTGISDGTHCTYPRTYITPNFQLNLGVKSTIGSSSLVEGRGTINIGNFSQISWNSTFELEISTANKYCPNGHDPKRVSIFAPHHLSWPGNKPDLPPDKRKYCRISIGNDVWIGRGNTLKTLDPDRPLVIGDGAVIAADSVVVKSVPPYAIVGGNPARFIKWRFEPKIIEGLQRIRWWDWNMEKIRDNYKYFDDPRQFVEMFDK